MTGHPSASAATEVRDQAIGRRAGAGSRTFHQRAGVALLASGLSSLSSFLTSISITRGESLTGVGQFALAFSVYVLVIGLVRATVTEAVLAGRTGQSATGDGIRRAGAIGAGAGALVLGIGLGVGSPYLVVVGPALWGLVIYDYVRGVNLGVGTPWAACAQDAGWAAMTVMSVGTAFLVPVPPVLIFTVWAFSGAAIGVVTAVRQGHRLTPGWGLDAVTSRTAASFGGQFLVTSGSAQLALTLVAATAGVGVVGALGAAQTALSPVTLLIAPLSALVVPYLGRARPVTRWARFVTAGPVLLASVGLILPLVIAICLLPDDIGRIVLGDNWTAARPLLPMLGIETVLVPVALVAFAGHRVQHAGGRALLVGAVLGLVRVTVVVGGGLLFQAEGTAAARTGVAVTAAFVWWLSYLTLRDRPVDRAAAQATVASA
ncbi:hypothetical protein O7606_09610 [Micromonospora sp. WMMD882]|uniref:hypothetical protein n=1 Tax=Micromonospora sp. WMMD882 TaxID=3015151 RepID=UPI00248CAB52|nr:hypothetical protein [Micromonospora sp. WMMD882]WBB81589.1 hypothetical protein O7606_09610 [Micromonospora sp. WMMD882]